MGWWTDTVTLGALKVDYLYFETAKESGNDDVDLVSLQMSNETREQGDPRPAFAWKGLKGSLDGTDSSDVIIAVGYLCTYGDISKLFPKITRMTPVDIIGFKFTGEVGDVCKAGIAYEVL